jgi:DNA-binding IclR family transcriptional regulator
MPFKMCVEFCKEKKMGRKPKSSVVNQPIPSIQKALAMLELFCSAKRGQTISELARTFGLPVSTCSSILYTLLSCGYLTRDDAGVFSLSMKLLGQANKAYGRTELNDIAQPELEKITAVTGLASALFMREDDSAVCLAKVEGTGHIRTAAHVGKHLPLHATCTGKVLLAYLPSEEVSTILPSGNLPQFTENTITSMSRLKDELARVVSLGYGVDDQEYGLGIRGISAPVFDGRGKVIAALSASGATFELEGHSPVIISALKTAALEVSKSFGYSESVVESVYRQAPAHIKVPAAAKERRSNDKLKKKSSPRGVTGRRG